MTRQSATAFNQPLNLDTSSATTMRGMFRVRPRRMQLLHCPAGSSVHAACTATAPPRPRASRPACHPSVSHVVTRQDAPAFNQPLSFDMSSVTDMSQMFYVRLCRAQRPAGSFVHAACTATAPTPSRLLPRVSPSVSPVVTRQSASAFNQPLNFDMSSVTDTGSMLRVRTSTRVPHRHRPYPTLALPTARIVLHVPRPDSAGHVGVVRCKQAAHPLRSGGQLGL